MWPLGRGMKGRVYHLSRVFRLWIHCLRNLSSMQFFVLQVLGLPGYRLCCRRRLGLVEKDLLDPLLGVVLWYSIVGKFTNLMIVIRSF